MELIQQGGFFDVSVLDAIRFSGEDYEKRVDALIPSAYVINTQDEETIRNTTMDYWLILEYPICAHVATMDAYLDENLLGSALSDRLEFSKLAMSIGSMTAKNGSCELFEADISESWENVNGTSAGHPKGVTLEMLSKFGQLITRWLRRHFK